MIRTRFVAGTAALFVLGFASAGRTQQTPAAAQAMVSSSSMDQMMRTCAKMRDDMAHNRPMGPNGTKLMADCQRMEQQMSSAPAPAGTLER